MFEQIMNYELWNISSHWLENFRQSELVFCSFLNFYFNFTAWKVSYNWQVDN